MGQPKTKAIGGGNATGVANDFNAFLSSILKGSGNIPGAGGGIGEAGNQTMDFRSILNQQLQGGSGDRGMNSGYFDAVRGGNPNAGNPADYSYTPHQLLNVDMNSPEFAALRDIQGRQTQSDLANLSAKFSSMGAGGRGTGAAYAAGNYLAEANPRNILAQGQLARDIQGLDLQNFGANAQNRQALLGLNQGQSGLDQGWAQLQAQTGLGLNAQSAQAIQQALSQLFAGFGQANQLGTAPRTQIQVPNAWQQFVGGVNDVTGMAKGVTDIFNPFSKKA